MADNNSKVALAFRAYIVAVSGGSHHCKYLVNATSQTGARAIAQDRYIQSYGTEIDEIRILSIVEPGDAYCLYDSYDNEEGA